ncbi:tripartite ATP-independent transporter solute receptor, DctP family [Raineyella antarctica]|uniref:Tripartite ATP-independent transporter solute receptor, DctP family n=1 Tax=Raineyella antarctica TaxID=1577474 RepID=A0A1G6GCN6_9ACTN|nr:TRAP transporter substrate-binding protein [Raineyella antarctica]SDB79762.1 tripartite ATP-independent transporter solute receptor, DctP family [Raineyella antarctica]
MRKPKVLAVIAAAALTLTLAACGGSGSSGTPGATSGKTLRLALNQTEAHPSYIALDNFGKRLATDTNDRWKVQVFPNETLGAQQEALQMVSNGSVDMAIVSGTQLENLNKDFRVLNMPMAFSSIDGQMKVIRDKSIVGDLFTSLEGNQHVTVLGGFTQGERSVYTKFGPVKTPADLNGKKLRVQESDLMIAMAQAMGASATPLAYGEVYTGLNSGVIDAAENNEVSYFTQKHFEVAPYFSNTKHLVGLDYLIINTDTLKKMSTEDRASFDKEWDAAMTEHTNLWQKSTEKAIADAKAGGAKFSDVDAAAFKSALEPLQAKFLTTDSQKALWDKLQAAQK